MDRHQVSLTRSFIGIAAVVALVMGIVFTTPVGRGSNAAADEAAGEWDRDEASEQAQELGQPVQVLEDTAEDVMVLANPDGSFTAELASGPVRVPDPESPTGWSDIDLSLVQSPEGLRPAVTEPDIVFSNGGGSGNLATITQGGLEYAIQAPASLPEPTVAGGTATYPGALSGMDLVLQARPAGFAQSWILHEAPAGPVVLDLPLSLQGLEAAVEDGRLVLTDESDNRVAQSTPAVMFGAEFDPHTDEPVHSSLVATAIVSGQGGPVLRVSPDQAFFSTPGLSWPVTIDPAPDFSVDADTYVKSSAPTTSYGSDQQLKSGTPDGSEAHRTLISFDGTEVLEDTHVLDAQLKLFEIHSYSCTASQVDLYDATSAFTSSTTWNSQPAAGDRYASATEAHGYSGSCPNDWVQLTTGGAGGLTLADLVQEWSWGTMQPHGLIVRAGSETDVQGWKKFASSDYGSNSPTLTVSYDIPPPDASDSWDGYTGWEQSVLHSPQDYVTDQLASGCHIDRPGNGAHATYTYKTFIPIGRQDERDLKLDEYSPLTPLTSEYPVLVLVHGGGWVAGCRGVVSREARLFAGRLLLQDEDVVEEKFIVFSIDHRLACDTGSYLDAPDSPLPYLCGWRWDTEDPNEDYQAQAGVRDIGDVIRWIKDTTGGWEDQAGSLYEYWDGENIMVVGASSGGNLVASFAGRAAADPDIRPTAVALLSGFPETGQASTQDWSCDAGSSMAETCWKSLNNYLNCGVVYGQAPDEAVEGCQEEDTEGEIRYEDASPINESWDYPDTPPIFIATAGYGGGNYDLSPLQLSQDLRDELVNNRAYSEISDPPSLKLCKVESGGHATSYLDKEIRNCDGDDEDDEVIESLVAFFVLHMT